MLDPRLPMEPQVPKHKVNEAAFNNYLIGWIAGFTPPFILILAEHFHWFGV